MKKISTSVSPFIMLIIPVVLFIGLSLIFNSTEDTSEEFVSIAKVENTQILEKGLISVIKLAIQK